MNLNNTTVKQLFDMCENIRYVTIIFRDTVLFSGDKEHPVVGVYHNSVYRKVNIFTNGVIITL